MKSSLLLFCCDLNLILSGLGCSSNYLHLPPVTVAGSLGPHDMEARAPALDQTPLCKVVAVSVTSDAVISQLCSARKA